MNRILTWKFLIPVGAVVAALPYLLPVRVFGVVLLANTLIMALGAGWSLIYRKQRTRIPIALITLAGFVMCEMNLDWALRGGATGPAGSIASSISSCIFVAAGAALLAARRPRHYREGLLDGIAALAAVGAVQWQWTDSHGLSGLAEVAKVVLPISGAILFAALLAVIWRLLYDKQQNRKVIASIMVANVGQGISAFVTSSWSDPTAPMWPYSVSMVITWFAVGAFTHSDFPRVVEPEPKYERRLNLMRWLGPTSALIVSPAITLALVFRHEAPSLPVGIAGVLLTLVVIMRIGRLLREREAGRKELTIREKRFRSLVQHGSDVIAVIDASGMVTYVSGGVQEVFGLRAKDLLGGPITHVLVERDRPWLATALSTEREVGQTVFVPSDLQLMREDGEIRWITARMTNHFGTEGIDGWVLNIHDTTDRKLAEHALSKMALYDSLTGLPNRTQLRDRLEQAIAESPGMTALLFCDLDGFKEVNDRLGHEVGDDVLRAVAGRWSRLLRSGDVLGRWGGDEFLIICPGIGSTQIASDVADRLLSSLGEPIPVSTGEVGLGCSVGLALHAEGESLDDLVSRADRAMYAAKRAGAGLQVV